MNTFFPLKKYILIYSLIGSLLSTIIPITVAVDHLHEGQFLLRFIDISALFCLVVNIFYISFWINIKYYKLTKIKLFFLNFLVLIIVSILSISIHFPIWKSTTHIPIVFYIRDEIVRNSTQQIKIAFNELQNENLSNQVRGLMQQINPHFFFNTLNTLSGLVQESPEKSEVFIDKLSHVFRYVLKMQENNKVLLAEELKFAEDYFFLLKMRFEEKIFLVFNIQQLSNENIAPLCTQLLFENVIKHNRMNRQFPVKIEIEIENNYLKVCNTFYPQKSNNSNGLGLKNLNKRCELLAGKSIIIEQTESTFCVKVPLINN